MKKSFPVILSELRKEKGLSQKEAAEQLGISQALLSHYEKGIRECSQSFLLKTADFYGVTCDYLLGKSTDRQGMGDFKSLLLSEETDADPIRKTIIKAICIVGETLSRNDATHGLHINEFISAQLYKLVLLEAKAGNLPKSWAGKLANNGNVNLSELYLSIIDRAAAASIVPSENKLNPCEDEPMPEALKTVMSITEKAILEKTLDNIPPISLDLLK